MEEILNGIRKFSIVAYFRWSVIDSVKSDWIYCTEFTRKESEIVPLMRRFWRLALRVDLRLKNLRKICSISQILQQNLKMIDILKVNSGKRSTSELTPRDALEYRKLSCLKFRLLFLIEDKRNNGTRTVVKSRKSIFDPVEGSFVASHGRFLAKLRQQIEFFMIFRVSFKSLI